MSLFTLYLAGVQLLSLPCHVFLPTYFQTDFCWALVIFNFCSNSPVTGWLQWVLWPDPLRSASLSLDCLLSPSFLRNSLYNLDLPYHVTLFFIVHNIFTIWPFGFFQVSFCLFFFSSNYKLSKKIHEDHMLQWLKYCA